MRAGRLWLVLRLAAWVPTLIPAALAAEIIEVGTGEITDVTVYLSGAEVIREVEAQVPTGPSTLEIDRFPDGVDPASIRTAVRGAPVAVSSITLAERTTRPDGDLEAMDLVIAALEDRLFELNQRGEDEKTLRAYLGAAAAAGTSQEEASSRSFEPAEITAIYELLGERFDELLAGRLERRRQKRDLDLELAEARKARAEAAREETFRVAQVRVEAQRTSTIVLSLSYFVPQAEWAPRYRATLDDSGTLELVAEAAVRQWTDRPWSSARVRLSTVRPSSSLSAPHLGSWRIAQRDRWEARGRTPGALSDRVNVGGNEAGQQAVFVAPKPQAPQQQSPGGLETTRTRYSVTFEVAGRTTVPGDGQPKQVELWRERLAAKVTYRAKPEMREAAFLEATIEVPERAPLLPGLLRIYTGETLLGSHRIAETAPGGELILPFGIDGRVEVSRVEIDASESRQGLGNKIREEARAYRVSITNLLNETIEIALEERIPVADDERIKVALSSDTTPGHQPSKTRRGVLIWKLEIPPGATSEVHFGFSVRAPREMAIEGLH